MRKGGSIFSSRGGGKNKRWIQSAIKKPGALSRQLGIPEEDKIPVTLLRKINNAKVGTVIKNPTKKGKRRIKVTRLLKWRASLALRLKGWSKKRKRKGRKR